MREPWATIFGTILALLAGIGLFNIGLWVLDTFYGKSPDKPQKSGDSILKEAKKSYEESRKDEKEALLDLVMVNLGISDQKRVSNLRILPVNKDFDAPKPSRCLATAEAMKLEAAELKEWRDTVESARARWPKDAWFCTVDNELTFTALPENDGSLKLYLVRKSPCPHYGSFGVMVTDGYTPVSSMDELGRVLWTK